MAEREEKGEPGQAPEKKTKNPPSNQMIFLGLVVAVIVLNGIVAVFLVKGTVNKMDPPKVASHEQSADSLHQKKEEHSEIGAVTEKPITQIVNIFGTNGSRFLRIEVVFGYDNVKYKNLGLVLEEKTAEFKDALIDLVSQIPLEELQKPETKDEIRRDLKRIVNERLGKKEGQIGEVFINDFIIQ
jgi:flagellar basal body-associated protein FliL